ncbi:TPA: phytanoyl-CoA dioxygenase family protein [Candidatus Poribacteria bacterium]|nr:phytanoyl-CoA dioxygenase family protein [Candidatus Poribacteria bacterium]
MITAEQRQQYQQDGYFIVRNLVEPSALAEIKAAILDFIDNPGDLEQVLDPELAVRQGKGEHLSHRAKFRKLQRLGRYRPTVWNNYYAHPNVLSVIRSLLGDDLLVKYDSVFLKPAKTGGATPWHQDIGLWRDNHVEAANAWIAIDPASKENGCMQFLPGSHHDGFIDHVLYDDSLHGELPRDLVANLEGRVNIELQPGDGVFWHSYMWHYSPPNSSDQGRIGMGAVWASLEQAQTSQRVKEYFWVMKDGQRLIHPPKKLIVDDGKHVPPPPFPPGY